ncbi:MAG: flagellar FlbD family protein [Methylocystaceae bacterium]
MIKLTRFNGEQMWVNMDIIECVEETPDTIVTLTTGKKLVVKESAEIIRQQVLERRQSVFAPYDIQHHREVTTDASR